MVVTKWREIVAILVGLLTQKQVSYGSELQVPGVTTLARVPVRIGGNLVFKSSILRTERRWLRAGYHNFPRLSKLGDFDYE